MGILRGKSNQKINGSSLAMVKCQANAVVVGRDINGELLYVARAYHRGVLTPGKKVPSHEVAYIAWEEKEHPKTEYEVLCNVVPKWVPTTFGEMIPSNSLIGGQSENEEILFIGRRKYGSSLTPGKVHPSHAGLFIPLDGKEIYHSWLMKFRLFNESYLD